MVLSSLMTLTSHVKVLAMSAYLDFLAASMILADTRLTGSISRGSREGGIFGSWRTWS